MSAEEIAETVITHRRGSFDAYELIGGVRHTEVSGHDAMHFVSSFTVGGDPSGLMRAGARAVVAENWIVSSPRFATPGYLDNGGRSRGRGDGIVSTTFAMPECHHSVALEA